MSSPMTKEEKSWIDNADYEDLLRRNRFSPCGDQIFVGESGAYYLQKMNGLRAAPGGQDMAIAASKRIGWERPK